MYFNVPATLWPDAHRTKFAPLERLWAPLTAVAGYWPFSTGDVLHTMNSIPVYGSRPWVVTFESVLPRTLTGKQDALLRLLRNRLLSPNCLGLIAMSDWAARMFRSCNEGWPELPTVLRKLQVLHPTVRVHSRAIRRLKRGEPIRLLFVGHLFALKGGIVALRIAQRALSEGLPIELHIVSGLKYGRGCFGDCQRREQYASDMRLMGLPNVFFHGRCRNERVLELMSQSHIKFLASLHETYGFSILEGFSCATPAFTSNVCAQPEINAADRGVILKLPTDELNRWAGLQEKNSPDYWNTVNCAYNALASQAFAALAAIHDEPEKIESMSLGALRAAETRHDPDTAALVLNRIYNQRLAPFANACISATKN
jgi:glycosyltransferase involved in cell wall biosynthesis